jgi:hypothetical protein
MKLSDILRDLAELMDQQGPGPQGADIGQNTTQQRLKTAQVSEPELDDNPVMVPPLQAKLEILKKSEGLPNVYDQEGTDELAAIKKNAGITTAQQEASDDEPLDY